MYIIYTGLNELLRFRERKYVEIGRRRIPLGTFSKIMMYATLKKALNESRRKWKVVERPEPLHYEEWEGFYLRNPEKALEKARIVLLSAGVMDVRVFQRKLKETGIYGAWSDELSLWLPEAIEELLEYYCYMRSFEKALKKFLHIEKKEHPLEIAIKQIPETYKLSKAVIRFEEIKKEYEKYEQLKKRILDEARKINLYRRSVIQQGIAFQTLIDRIKEILKEENFEANLENIHLALYLYWKTKPSLPEPIATLIRKCAKNIDNLRKSLTYT